MEAKDRLLTNDLGANKVNYDSRNSEHSWVRGKWKMEQYTGVDKEGGVGNVVFTRN